MVRCADKATAEKVKSNEPPALIFIDGDGQEYFRTVIGAGNADEALQKGLDKYPRKDVSWATGDLASVLAQAREQNRLVALAFMDDKKDSETFAINLTDRWIAKHHEKLVFFRMNLDRNSPEAREYGVTLAPSLLILNPAEEGDAKKRIVTSALDKKELLTLRNTVVKAIEKTARTSSNR